LATAPFNRKQTKPPGNGSPAPDGRERGVGLRQVAKAAGVSTATVSRAINNPEAVSQDLRERIGAVIERLGWVPDGAARALATRRSFTIGAVFPTLTQGDFGRAAHAIQNELLGRGYTLLLACSEYDLDQEFQQVRKFVERGVDGLILVGQAHHPDLLGFLERQKLPFIQTFVYDPATHGTCIGPDNHKTLYKLTEYLVGLGHTRFGVIAQSTRNNDRSTARLAGIRDSLANHGLAVRPQHLLIGQWTIAEGRQLFRQMIEAEPRPTVILCGNAYLSVGAMVEALSLGIKVPEEISIVGYDDIEIMSHLPVPVTTVRVPGEDVGTGAARWLLARVNNQEADVALEYEAEIVIRASCGPPPGGHIVREG
jgi:LacI family transcriptional regulator